jgi:4-diphosphocytidyl-2-C-methyl-D-erythritol kinase
MTSYAAPAKLNLFLHVTGRRADGYHLLQSVFQLIDLADVLHFSLRQDGEIVRLNDLPGVPQASDLCVRAARLLQSAARERGLAAPGASIRLDKHIPMGGGLGGGSSDAATTLMALNDLWQCRRAYANGPFPGRGRAVFSAGSKRLCRGNWGAADTACHKR